MKGISTFVAKIGVRNAPSQRLFAQLGYREIGRSDVFREITYECKIEDAGEQPSSVRSRMHYQALPHSHPSLSMEGSLQNA